MSYSAVLVAAERGLRKSHQILVHRQPTDLETGRELMSHLQVARPDSTVKPVLCLIGHRNNLVESLKLGNAEYRSENLVASNFHLPIDLLENRGLNEISLLQSRLRRFLPSAEKS